MLKVLLLSRDPRWTGGVVNFVETLKKNLSDDVIVEEVLVGQRISWMGRLLRPLVPVVDAIRLGYRVARGAADVVHVNPSLNTRSLLRDGLFLAVLRLAGIRHLVVFFHGWEADVEEKIHQNVLRRWWFWRVFGKDADVFVLASQFKASLEEMGFNPSRVHLFTTMFDGDQVPRTMGIPKQGMKLLFMSRFERAKGVYELLEAFKKVHVDYPLASLVFAGDGPEMQGMQAWVKRNDLSEMVSFLGYLRGEGKILALEEASLFIFPTYYDEGCPVSLLEAMASGLPLITGAAGGIPDIVIDGVHGVLLREVTASSVEVAMRSMLSEPDDLKRIGEHNYRNAWEKYEASVVTKIIENTYHELAGRS